MLRITLGSDINIDFNAQVFINGKNMCARIHLVAQFLLYSLRRRFPTRVEQKQQFMKIISTAPRFENTLNTTEIRLELHV